MICPSISLVKHEWMQWLFLPYFPAFLELVRANNSDLGRRQRRAFRQLLKQTVEFIVPHKYQYQNQYSCRPPPLFMMTISLLQAVVFIYNSVIFYRETQVYLVTVMQNSLCDLPFHVSGNCLVPEGFGIRSPDLFVPDLECCYFSAFPHGAATRSAAFSQCHAWSAGYTECQIW